MSTSIYERVHTSVATIGQAMSIATMQINIAFEQLARAQTLLTELQSNPPVDGKVQSPEYYTNLMAEFILQMQRLKDMFDEDRKKVNKIYMACCSTWNIKMVENCNFTSETQDGSKVTVKPRGFFNVSDSVAFLEWLKINKPEHATMQILVSEYALKVKPLEQLCEERRENGLGLPDGITEHTEPGARVEYAKPQ